MILELFAQPTPEPSAYPTSGDFWSPSSWAPAIHELGVIGFFALVMFVALSYVFWRQLHQPSNSKQMRALKQLFAEAVERNMRLRKVLRVNSEVTQCTADILGIIVEAVVNDVKARGVVTEKLLRIRTKLDYLQDALDAAPPPVPEELTLDDDNDKEIA